MPTLQPSVDEIDLRAEPRKSIFVLATLYARTGSAPVKIRDMSPNGALIEGAVIPPPGTKVRLSRGSLEITGDIIWCKELRAGLRFAARASVSDWLPSAHSVASQQRVDHMVEQARNSLADLPCKVGLTTVRPACVTASELTALSQAIESLAGDLAEDEALVARHASKLQTLDVASQLLRRLAAER